MGDRGLCAMERVPSAEFKSSASFYLGDGAVVEARADRYEDQPYEDEPQSVLSCLGSTDQLRTELYLDTPRPQNSSGASAEDSEPTYVARAVASGPPCYRKHVVLVRHGESDGQTAKSRGLLRSHESLLDCGLTRKGWTQAYTLSKSWSQHSAEDAPIELVVCSSLTRAIQTACIATEGFDCPIVSHPGCAELGGGKSIPENRSRPVRELRRDDALTSIPRFAEVDFSLAEGESGSEENLSSFLEWLRCRPEAEVFVVCHHNVILKLLNMFKLRGSLHKVANCVPMHCVFEGNQMVDMSERSIKLADIVEGDTPQKGSAVQPQNRAGKLKEKLAAKALANNTRKQKKKK